MKRFEFRLQRVLNYRARIEEHAERLYVEARAQRELAQRRLDGLRDTLKSTLARAGPFALEDVRRRRDYCDALEDRMRQQEVILTTLYSDEARMRERWLAARTEREILSKLREKAEADYRIEVNHVEQRELDEWAALRHEAA